MSYINNQNIKMADSPNLDAFTHLRVSQTENIFNSKQLYGDDTSIWSTYSKFYMGGTIIYDTKNSN